MFNKGSNYRLEHHVADLDLGKRFDTTLHDLIQVSFHELKNQMEFVAISNDLLQFDDVTMAKDA